MLNSFNKQEFSGTAFLSKLNDTDKEPSKFALIPDEDDEMSLEEHLENLSNRYASQGSKSQNPTEFSDSLDANLDLDMRITPEGYFNRKVTISLQNKDSGR